MKIAKLFLFLILIQFLNSLNEIVAQETNHHSNTIILNEQNSPVLLDDSVKYIIRIESQYCNWCHVMDRMVYQNDSLINVLEEEMIKVYKLDVNEMSPIIFDGKKYMYLDKIRAHGLAIFLSNNNLTLPITIFIQKSKDINTIFHGYILLDDFMKHLDEFLKK